MKDTEQLRDEVKTAIDGILRHHEHPIDTHPLDVNEIISLIEAHTREARIDTAKYFKKYMISTSPFIEEIIDPYIENLEQLRHQQEGSK